MSRLSCSFALMTCLFCILVSICGPACCDSTRCFEDGAGFNRECSVKADVRCASAHCLGLPARSMLVIVRGTGVRRCFAVAVVLVRLVGRGRAVFYSIGCQRGRICGGGNLFVSLELNLWLYLL